MLTKDLVKYRITGGQIRLPFLDVENQGFLQLAASVLEIFKNGQGRCEWELEAALADLVCDRQLVKKGLFKLLIDQSEFSQPDPVIEETRWEVLLFAFKERKERVFESIEQYRETVLSNYKGVGEDLFADLPEFRRLIKTAEFTSKELLDRYNCALVQAVILRSSEVTINLSRVDLKMRRWFFRMLKFHHILARVERPEGEDCIVHLSGPLSIFEGATSYGLKIANFFPYVLLLDSFQFIAKLDLDRRKGQLQLDESLGLKSHYKLKSNYLPEDFIHAVEGFNKHKNDWSAKVGVDFVHLGQQSYCFPDITIESTKGEKVHVELFHRWHLHQLEQRLKVLDDSGRKDLRIGVCASIAKKKETLQAIKNSKTFNRYGFVFRDYPSAKQLQESIEEK